MESLILSIFKYTSTWAWKMCAFLCFHFFLVHLFIRQSTTASPQCIWISRPSPPPSPLPPKSAPQPPPSPPTPLSALPLSMPPQSLAPNSPLLPHPSLSRSMPTHRSQSRCTRGWLRWCLGEMLCPYTASRHQKLLIWMSTFLCRTAENHPKCSDYKCLIVFGTEYVGISMQNCRNAS